MGRNEPCGTDDWDMANRSATTRIERAEPCGARFHTIATHERKNGDILGP